MTKDIPTVPGLLAYCSWLACLATRGAVAETPSGHPLLFLWKDSKPTRAALERSQWFLANM